VRRPHPIEAESYRILRRLVDLSSLGPLGRAVVERVVHATADPAWAADLVLDEPALRLGLHALRAGVPVVADVRMTAAGITAREALCAIDLAGATGGGGPRDPTRGESRDPTQGESRDPTRGESRDPTRGGAAGPLGAAGDTRAAAGVRAAAARVGSGAVWVVGCAPTALDALLALDADPALVIGVPVGFVGAVQAKRALAASGLPAVTNRSARGGAAVAAAALNALLYAARDAADPETDGGRDRA
jgi:precorrin-8X/cobalt-precorrin-8 methylmutase